MESKTIGTENGFVETGEGLITTGQHAGILGALELLCIPVVVVFPRLYARIKVHRIEPKFLKVNFTVHKPQILK